MEFAEVRDVFEVTDDRCCERLAMLATLPWVRFLWCPGAGASAASLDVLVLLGLESVLPSKGPGAMVLMRLAMFSPPSKRGLSGANKGLGWA